jgi:hypothetical protein
VSVPEGAASPRQATQKNVRINSRERRWEISTLESLVAKWRDERFPKTFQNKDPRLLLVAVNNNLIRVNEFSSMPISHGDGITIVVGAIAGG